MSTTSRSIPVAGVAWAIAAAATSAANQPAPPAPPDDGGAGSFVLIMEGLETRPVQVVQIGERHLVYLDAHRSWQTVDLAACLGLFAPDAVSADAPEGVLELADGQRLPGRAISNAPPETAVLTWNHRWLGRLDVPLDAIRSLRLTAASPAIEPGDADRVLLANGDRLEGFIVTLGDPISLEVIGPDGPQVIEVPLERASAVAMVTPDRTATARRVWFRDGTIVDISSLQLGDDGFVRLDTPLVSGQREIEPLRLEEIAAILFDPRGMVPLAALPPSLVEGGQARYRVPPPEVEDRLAPLDLARVELRGPVVVHYALPAGARRFAAEAWLPRSARTWGDLELIVRDDDLVVFRQRISHETPFASLNVPVRGAELTIELTEGRYGPIQDRVVLEQAMVLVGE